MAKSDNTVTKTYLLPLSERRLSVLPSGVDRGVGTRTSLEGCLIFGLDGENGACGIPLNSQFPITLSQAFLFVLTKFSGTSMS